ncbi:MAG: TRAP transporter small permease [Pseudomonadota bacterium]
MARWLGRFTAALSTVSAFLLFAVGAMLTYEVVARYFFNAPTIWAEELSRLFMIWAVFVGSAGLLSGWHHIRVTVVVERLPLPVQRFFECFALWFVAVIAAFVAWNGFPIAAGSFDVGRTTGSMLDIPSWWMQAAVPVGFGLIALQAFVVGLRVLWDHDRPVPGSAAHAD